MNVRLATEGDSQRWNEFVFTSSDGSFLQSWEWGQFQQAQGVSFWRIMVEEGDQIHGVALVVKRALPLGKAWLYLPRGPVLGAGAQREQVWQQLSQKITEVTEAEKIVFVRCDPAWTTNTLGEDWHKADREIQPRATRMLDLTQTEDALLAGMHAKTRYNIKVAQKKGVQIRFSTALSDLEHFLRISEQVQTRSGFRYHPAGYYKTMLQVLGGQQKAEVVLASYNGAVIAANILITGGKTVTYAHGASSNEHRNVMAPYLMHWEAIKQAQAAGMQRYDFYGVAPAGSPANHPWAGITRFKEGFGGQLQEYIGAYDRIMNQWWYGSYTLAQQVRKHLR